MKGTIRKTPKAGAHVDSYPHLPSSCTFLVRPERLPRKEIPLAVHSVGHYRVDPHWKDQVKTMQFFQLFWGVSGTGVVMQNGKAQTLKPGDIAVLHAGMEHRVYALEETWEYCWLALDGEMVVDVAEAMQLGAGVQHAGEIPRSTFDRLELAVRDVTVNGQRWAALIGYELLTLASQGIFGETSSNVVDEALHIIHEEWNNPHLNVQLLSDRLNRNRSTLSRMFRQAKGMTAIEYMRRLRIQNALAELKQTDDSIADIAARCGFGDQGYFSRQVRRYTGYSPLQFRKQ
jgi:AraC-like DNA-binding protein